MQGSKLYVGNLTYSVTEEQLKKLFSAYGDVKEVRVIERKGFGFVDMATPEDAEKAKKGENNNASPFEKGGMREDFSSNLLITDRVPNQREYGEWPCLRPPHRL